MNYKKVIKPLTIALAISCTPNLLYAEEGCQQAESLYQQAKTAVDSTERLILMEQATSLCKTSYGLHYQLGRLYVSENKHEKAEETYTEAYGLAPTSKERAQVLGRKAELFHKSGMKVKAMEAIEASRDLIKLEGGTIPDWINSLTLEIESSLEVDGVVQSKDISSVLASRSFAVMPKINLRILFEFDKSSLLPQGRMQIHELAKALESTLRNNEAKVDVIGHTDKQGDNQYNETLSLKRAQRVKDELVSINPYFADRIYASGKGETDLRFPGNSETDHLNNRRVEIKLAN